MILFFLVVAVVSLVLFILGFAAAGCRLRALRLTLIVATLALAALYVAGLVAGAAWVIDCPSCTDSATADMSRRDSFILLVLVFGVPLLVLSLSAIGGDLFGRLFRPPAERPDD